MVRVFPPCVLTFLSRRALKRPIESVLQDRGRLTRIDLLRAGGVETARVPFANPVEGKTNED